ncbi:GMC oxidoreductase [Fibrella aestuarina]|nr:GMC family oxidoreductase [Fibrella aestuarina]
MSASPAPPFAQRTHAANRYDAIVIGSGISGGWAAKELTQKGLRVLLLERGRPIEHINDYKTALTPSWEMPHRGRKTVAEADAYRLTSRNYGVDEYNKGFYVSEIDSPYVQTQNEDFVWARGHQVGGRSLTWGRQCYRWSDLDFGDNLRDGHGVDWPIRYKDIEPWYTYVEKFVGISGSKEGLPHLPDSPEFLPPMAMNCVEKHAAMQIAKTYADRRLIIGRVANLTAPKLGRGPCQFRNACDRGCPFGGYFSSNAATLPVAAATGRLTLRPYSIVTRLLYDDAKKRATGVEVLDAETGAMHAYQARLIFVNASTISTTMILQQSTSPRFPNGLGNDSDQLGRNLVTHSKISVGGRYDGFLDQYTYGRRANGIYVPRFRNVTQQHADFRRGYNYQGGGSRPRIDVNTPVDGQAFGAAWKDSLPYPADHWSLGLTAFGEMLPDPNNRVRPSATVRDKWGLAVPEIDFNWSANDYAMMADAVREGRTMLEQIGCQQITSDPPRAIRSTVHEMGTARMGRDPKTSVLNAHNQVHACTNVFVTDGASMASASCVNPSLTYMALTARAVDHAVREMKRGVL